MTFASIITRSITDDIVREAFTIWEAYEKEVRSFAELAPNDEVFEKMLAYFPSFEYILDQAAKRLRDMTRNT